REDPAAALLAGARAGALAVLDALRWGPPVGRAPAPRSPAAEAVAWLLRERLLLPGTGGHVVLPREVAWRLRDGRTHPAPPAPPAPARPARGLAAEGVAAESAVAAERAVRLVEALLRLWERTPPHVLRGGGVGVRDLRRTAQALDVPEPEAALLVEVAGAAGLVADDGEELPAFLPTVAADVWLATDLPRRWAALVRAWATTTRAPWLVGTRDDHDAPRAALDPTVHRTWGPRLRRAVLEVLAADPPAAPRPADDVLAALRHRAPRSVPPEVAVRAVLDEAGLLGVLGAGALGGPGRALLDALHEGAAPADPSRGEAPRGARPADPVATALAQALPAPVDVLLLQADLTGVVPGRPDDDLAALLDRTARVESRGGALTVRFTADSVREGLDGGLAADELLAGLARHAPGGAVPQPLEYLVRDVARRHGRLRTGAVDGYLRSDDPGALLGLVEDPRLAALGLFPLAPTVLGARATPTEVLVALRAIGRAPVAEGPDGRVVHPGAAPARARGRTPRSPSPAAGPPDERRLTDLVARLRSADRVDGAAGSDEAGTAAAGGPGAPGAGGSPGAPTTGARQRPLRPGVGPRAPRPADGTADPAAALVLLRQAAAERAEVRVELVGPDGRLQERTLRPLRVDAGRLRAVDLQRSAELTVAVHHIASVSPVRPLDAPADTPA
ncbi:helicase-associated domain-containing protein, partial [Cellulomonas endophytica]|uniref:helicase-associated domain-containing protein n=1 Tax=Cellulomonas endophytica TaxID=2494735 RepID=UPI001010E6E9